MTRSELRLDSGGVGHELGRTDGTCRSTACGSALRYADPGPPLLVMGIGGNIEMWEPFERALESAPIQTITCDAPGTGKSSGWKVPRRTGRSPDSSRA